MIIGGLNPRAISVLFNPGHYQKSSRQSDIRLCKSIAKILQNYYNSIARVLHDVDCDQH